MAPQEITHPVPTRLSPSEKARFERAARRSGYPSFSAFVRAALEEKTSRAIPASVWDRILALSTTLSISPPRAIVFLLDAYASAAIFPAARKPPPP